MGRQLNIRSDEAYAIAHEVAEQTGRQVSDVVLQALREYGSKFADGPKLTAAQNAEFAAIRAIARKAMARSSSSASSEEIMNGMYDDRGLPI